MCALRICDLGLLHIPEKVITSVLSVLARTQLAEVSVSISKIKRLIHVTGRKVTLKEI